MDDRYEKTKSRIEGQYCALTNIKLFLSASRPFERRRFVDNGKSRTCLNIKRNLEDQFSARTSLSNSYAAPRLRLTGPSTATNQALASPHAITGDRLNSQRCEAVTRIADQTVEINGATSVFYYNGRKPLSVPILCRITHTEIKSQTD